ncbi:YdcF family protein [Niabella aurantiaca]|uniref:YdcF family protein n=1 Tax=Niabella aurantiaca TaxID=379900 RepID=UPI00037D5ECF|nr:YdcF family protein [Niabella aurantiaca]
MAVLGLALFLVSLCGCVSYRKRPTRLYEKVLSKKMTFDAGIVPGVPFKDGKWDTVMKGRVIWATQLYKQGIIRNIIFSGGAVYSPYYEARIMGLYAQQLGVDAAHIFYETRAEHSTENVFYSYQIARRQGFKSVALITDPFQSSMMKRFTRRKFGTPVVHIPFMVDTLKKYNDIDPVIDPSPAYVQPFRSILEREGFFRRFRGTLGAFIPWENRRRKRARPL